MALEKRALKAAIDIAQTFRIECSQAAIIHRSNNIVVRLKPSPVVAKISNSEHSAPYFSLEMDVCRFLANTDAPSMHPSSLAPQEVHHRNGFAITLWEFVEGHHREDFCNATALNLLNSLHRRLSSYPGKIPYFLDKPIGCLKALEASSIAMAGLSRQDRSLLTRFLADEIQKFQTKHLNVQVLHGDTQARNLLWVSESKAVWLDFESVCLGPREWDYVKMVGTEPVEGADAELQNELSTLVSACVSTWCWQKAHREPEVQEAAAYHLNRVKEKFRS